MQWKAIINHRAERRVTEDPIQQPMEEDEEEHGGDREHDDAGLVQKHLGPRTRKCLLVLDIMWQLDSGHVFS